MGLIVIALATVSKIVAFYNPDAVLGVNKIHNYFLFYVTSLSGTCSVIIFSIMLWNKFSGNILFNNIFGFFRYIALQGLPILATHCYIIYVVDILLKTIGLNNLLLVFSIKIIAIIFITYFIIVPLVYSKFYFVFGKDKAKWNSFIFNK